MVPLKEMKRLGFPRRFRCRDVRLTAMSVSLNLKVTSRTMTRLALVIAAGSALTLLGIARTAPAKIREITLERTPCFGTCPVYSLTLKEDGTAIYKGTRFVDRIGTYEGHFNPGDLDRLASTMARLGGAKWKASYTANVTDLPSQIVTIKTSSGKRTIREYGSTGPEGLWAFQEIIDGVGANVGKWRKLGQSQSQ